MEAYQVKDYPKGERRGKMNSGSLSAFEVPPKGSIHLKVTSREPLKELYRKTHSRGLVKALKEAYSSLNLKSIKTGVIQ